MAATAAVAGLAKIVLAPFPCRPSKFLFEVEMHKAPAGILSSFIAKQAEQPGDLNSAPNALNISTSPSFSACLATF